jgi:hypothetical protein
MGASWLTCIFVASCLQVDNVDLKSNVLAAYVAGGLSRELPAIMTSMRLAADGSFEVRCVMHGWVGGEWMDGWMGVLPWARKAKH